MLRNTLIDIMNGWKAATQEKFTNHPIAQEIRQTLKSDIQNIIIPNIQISRLLEVLALETGQMSLGYQS